MDAINREQMAAAWNKRKAQIDEMFWNGTDDKQIFNELCCSLYSGDEFKNVSGVINNDICGLINTACHIIIADYALSTLLDRQTISMPDHSEILATIFAQLKRDNIELQSMCNSVDEADTSDWFYSNDNERSMVHSAIKEVWDRA